MRWLKHRLAATGPEVADEAERERANRDNDNEAALRAKAVEMNGAQEF